MENPIPRKRPVSGKHAMHIVMRSSQARGRQSMLRFRKQVDGILSRQAKRWGIRIYRFENVGNHLHILLRCFHRRRLIGFLRSISGLIARKILGSERGRPQKDQSFWDARPFSRIVPWGRAYNGLQRYFDKNRLEALGFDTTRLVAFLEKGIWVNSS